MKRKLNEVETFTLEGIIKLSESKWGVKYTMGIVDILYLHHLISRKIVNENENSMKNYLLKEGYESMMVLSMIKRYNKVKDDLFQYDWRTQSILDRIQSYGDAKSITSWETIDGMVIGLVRENIGYKVVDISDGTEKIVATIKEGVNWKQSTLTNKQMNFITKNAVLLKQPKGII
jgi:UDP-N-acetylenolpyruvoylglucosamine reductase